MMLEILMAVGVVLVFLVVFMLGIRQGAKMAKQEIDRRFAENLDLPIEAISYAPPGLVRYEFTLPDGRGNVYACSNGRAYLRREGRWHRFTSISGEKSA